MSDTAHTTPGQSLLERLYSRGAIRPSIGATSSFYQRLGLPDPWLDEGEWSVDHMEEQGMYFFLSAAPYYKRMRDDRQREWRARRRLLTRVAESSHVLQVRAFERMASTRTTAGAWLSLKRPSIAVSADSLMVMLPPIGEPEEAEEATGPGRRQRGEGRRRSGWARRPETQVEAASKRAPRTVAAVPAALEEVIVLASSSQRRVIRRIIEEGRRGSRARRRRGRRRAHGDADGVDAVPR